MTKTRRLRALRRVLRGKLQLPPEPEAEPEEEEIA